jgi:hypothetical protein
MHGCLISNSISLDFLMEIIMALVTLHLQLNIS